MTEYSTAPAVESALNYTKTAAVGVLIIASWTVVGLFRAVCFIPQLIGFILHVLIHLYAVVIAGVLLWVAYMLITTGL